MSNKPIAGAIFSLVLTVMGFNQLAVAESKQPLKPKFKTNTCKKLPCKKPLNKSRRKFRAECRAMRGRLIGNTCTIRNRGIK